MGKEVYLVRVSKGEWMSSWTYTETNISPCELVEIALEALPKVFED